MSDLPTSGLERFSLAGRVILVTGATHGLGLAIARGMAAAGAVVGINGRDAECAGQVAGDIPGAFPAPFDVTDLEGAAAALDAIVARHGRLDVLVNNAAVATAGPWRRSVRGLPPAPRDQPRGPVRWPDASPCSAPGSPRSWWGWPSSWPPTPRPTSGARC